MAHFLKFWGIGHAYKWIYGTFVECRYDFPIYCHIKRKNTKMPIISLKMPKMTSYLYHNTILRRETFPEILVKIWVDDVILLDMTWFSYIFPYYDVIDKNADVSKNNDVIVKIIIVNKGRNFCGRNFCGIYFCGLTII